MKFSFAPMEGITGYVYRNVYHRYFGQVDCYYSPFISTTQKRALRNKELRDVLPENNPGVKLIPQILGNNAQDFLFTAHQLRSLGYTTVNLNLGCPARTVVSKGKGSGFLAHPVALNRFLEEIYTINGMKISIKTRLGKDDPEEFYGLLQIFNQYPVEELIIHPRIQQDFYRNKPNWEMFAVAYKESRNPVCYNGDIFTVEDYQRLCHAFPALDSVMLGRGLLSDPNLIAEIKGGEKASLERQREYIDCLYEEYCRTLSGETPVLHKMKEIWGFFINNFPDARDYQKKIQKCKSLGEYRQIQRELFQGMV